MEVNEEFVDGVVDDLERIGACILDVETMWKQTNHESRKLKPDVEDVWDMREGNRPTMIGQIRIALIIMTHPGFEDLQ